MSGQIEIKQSLKKAYRKQRPTRAEIELLRLELAKMLNEANPKESEEYHKGLLKDFLKKTAYSDYFINTKDRSDLVIHNDKDSKSSVGVIIETKRPSSKTGMPTANNLNKKAMQELLLYFLRERVTKKNFEIKYLIVTNLYEWFVFDANEFEKIAEVAKLKKHFKDFEEGRLSFDKTKLFYKEIAGPALKQVNDKIRFVHFDIRDYEKYLQKQTKTGDSQLIELQKILSPTHLLKLPFANDSNTLNKDFYNELLHIIGLEEYKEKSKKLIRRKLKENRNEDSLIEATITEITSLYKLSQVKDIERFGGTEDERLYNVALELVITWTNRILFLKLLESQVVSYHNKSKDYLFLNKQKVAEYDDLNTLFFQVLAVETKSRRQRIKNKFPNVPYLNSSLFDPTELEQQAIFISNLPDDTALSLYKKTVVKSDSEKINTLEYLFRFLDAYDFSSEGNEDIAEDNKTLINASVLGLIFEKINGYKDGSFFTPGFVTMYMCKEAIRRVVVQKFREQTDFDGDDFTDLANFTAGVYKKAELEKYNGTINSLKICDPAVGSGHFLVSALNEIIAVKAELGILTDDGGKPFRNYLIDVENDELMILNASGEFFKYDLQNRETHRIQEALFHEKQTIIEKCLFGVDINPNSVNICRLRLWIELLKNAYYKEGGELETLPNIDINIKCGNSLISRYPLDTNLKEVLRESKFSIDAYRLAVNCYRNAENKEQKREMEKLIENIKGTFTAWIDEHHPKRKKLAKLRGKMIDLVDQGRLFQTESKKSKQKKFEKLSKEIKKAEAEVEELKNGVIYRSAFEWRFEFPEVIDEKTGDFIGFDIVIGNPPYGLFNKKQNQKVALTIQKEAIEIIKGDFPVAASGGINACRIFFNLGLNLSRKNGYQSMIIPFGILTDKTSVNLR
ncbi:MAG: type II restriction endonuclease, partial [Planctomycetes bacterium]|nr:type II restriction endonuclease [Planctomycetota bacterium]